MSVGDERLRLGQERRLIFLNFANFGGMGIPPERAKQMLAEEFARSPEQVAREIALVRDKIREYRHRRCIAPAGIKTDASGRRTGGRVDPQYGVLPPLPCDTEFEIIESRAALLDSLRFVTDENLSSEHLQIPTLRTHTIESVDHLQEAARATRATVSEVR